MKTTSSAYAPPMNYAAVAEAVKAETTVTDTDNKKESDTNLFIKQDLIAYNLAKKDELEKSSPQAKAQSGLKDNSGRLSARLSSAQTQFDVRWVIAEAYGELLSLNIAASGNNDAAKLARAYIKRIQSLLNNADRKLSDLGAEERIMRQRAVEQQKRREQQIKQNQERVREHNERIRELSRELNGRRSERRNRERTWGAGAYPLPSRLFIGNAHGFEVPNLVAPLCQNIFDITPVQIQVSAHYENVVNQVSDFVF